MTREEAKGMLPIMQAYADGKTIQFLDRGKWYDGEESFHERLKEELEKLKNDETTTSEENTRMEQG